MSGDCPITGEYNSNIYVKIVNINIKNIFFLKKKKNVKYENIPSITCATSSIRLMYFGSVIQVFTNLIKGAKEASSRPAIAIVKPSRNISS